MSESSSPSEFRKAMTKTDVGAAGQKGRSNQGGIGIHKAHKDLFGVLDPQAPNPMLEVKVTDWTGKEWTFKYRYWNQETRNEYRLEGTKPFFRAYGIGVGTELRFRRDGTGFRVDLLKPGSENEEFDDPEEARGVPEGARLRVEVNRYERSRANRQACIDHHGRTCACCEMSFAARYGADASDIIHVHHVTPVSALGDGYEIDPVKDLRPVCPNCHAVIHQAGVELLGIDHVRSMLATAT